MPLFFFWGQKVCRKSKSLKKIHYLTLLFCLFSVPPNKPTIFDESGREVRDLIGPYLEGDTIVLKCIASGGKKNFIILNK